MSDNYDYSDNIYHADYRAEKSTHSRKGKTKAKHSAEKLNKKIVQFKIKNNLGPDVWVSAYDVHKAKADKKRKHMYAKNARTNGYAYKQFVNSGFIPTDDADGVFLNENQDFWEQGDYNFDDEYEDCWEYRSYTYSDYDCDSCRSYSFDDTDDWDRLSKASRKTTRTNRTYMW